ncbi:MAG: hypothetical protein H7070_02745 [Saprospiraceae bacterium]|nr:hypothetical protein [Pyrinomonadaceae bacterium]
MKFVTLVVTTEGISGEAKAAARPAGIIEMIYEMHGRTAAAASDKVARASGSIDTITVTDGLIITTVTDVITADINPGRNVEIRKAASRMRLFPFDHNCSG